MLISVRSCLPGVCKVDTTMIVLYWQMEVMYEASRAEWRLMNQCHERWQLSRDERVGARVCVCGFVRMLVENKEVEYHAETKTRRGRGRGESRADVQDKRHEMNKTMLPRAAPAQHNHNTNKNRPVGYPLNVDNHLKKLSYVYVHVHVLSLYV